MDVEVVASDDELQAESLVQSESVLVTARSARSAGRHTPATSAGCNYAGSPALETFGAVESTAVALLVGFDCWLRISELANLSVSDIIDQRGHPDVAFRGVVVFLRETKTGARQAVRVADPDGVPEPAQLPGAHSGTADALSGLGGGPQP